MILLKEIFDHYKIYCDMDGVLVDFVKGFGKISDDPSAKHPTKYDKKHGKEAFWKLIRSHGEDYWKDLEWMPDGKTLWSYIRSKNPSILSTPDVGFKPSYNGKRQWVSQHLGNPEVILTDKKQQYSNKNSILIDDMNDNINSWQSKGGIGILHRSATDTISKLKKLGL